MLKQRQVPTSEDETFIDCYFHEQFGRRLSFYSDRAIKDVDLSGYDKLSIYSIRGYCVTISYSNKGKNEYMLYRVKSDKFKLIDYFVEDCDCNTYTSTSIRESLIKKGSIWRHIAMAKISRGGQDVADHMDNRTKGFIYSQTVSTTLDIQLLTDKDSYIARNARHINLDNGCILSDSYFTIYGTNYEAERYGCNIAVVWITPEGKIRNEKITLPDGRYQVDCVNRTYWKVGDLYYTQLYFEPYSLVDLCIQVIRGMDEVDTGILPLDLIERVRRN
jgi:hypothetical protein